MELKGSRPGGSREGWEAAIAWRMWCPACGLESPAILGLLMPPQWSALEEPVAILRSTCARDHLTECLLNVSVLYEGGRVRAVGLGQAGCGYDKQWREVGKELVSSLGQPVQSTRRGRTTTIRFWIVWALNWLRCWASGG